MIEIRQLTKRFAEVTAVDAVDLTIESGEFLTLLGPSGCGKTTLLRMLSGFETPTSGSIVINGQEVTHTPPYRRNVNQVFQSYALFPHLNVRENIRFGLRMQRVGRSEAERRIEEVVELVSLQGFEARMPHELSGGQRQRVALARAIVPRPEVLLLDEPLSALDAKLRQQMQIELKRLQKRLNMTFILVTHDQEEAVTMSDRIAVLNRGRIEQLGSPSEIYHQPRSSFVAQFVGESNLIGAEWQADAGENVEVVLDGGLRIVVDREDWPAGARRAMVSVRPEKLHVARHPIEAENVFQAEVTEEIFTGVMDRLWLRTTAGTTFHAVVANESAMLEAIHEGDRVWCGLHTDDIVVLRAEEQTPGAVM